MFDDCCAIDSTSEDNWTDIAFLFLFFNANWGREYKKELRNRRRIYTYLYKYLTDLILEHTSTLIWQLYLKER